jgi:tetratricopeptide (TPR) repeat protein/tRNA A-37 threonylcarbamoyl transferase component Bud32
MAANPSFTPGQILGHFRLIEEIGAGGMGIVFRARDTRLERDVAVKVLNAKTLTDATARKRFRREALILSRLNHPNVEAVYDFHTEQGLDYLVMEYVPGSSLNERLESGALPENDVLALGIQLARGLAAAHSQHIVHRDLKPGNLRVTPDSVLKILDFGLAELAVMPDDETLTEDVALQNSLAGTPPYIAPEQVLGYEPDARSDIYSAGVVLYELATGSRPFRQRGQALRDAIVHSPPPSLRSQKQDISPGLQAVILKCLEKDPKLRYQSANALLLDLEQVGAARTTRGVVLWAAVLLLVIVCGIVAWKWLRPQPVQQRIMAVLPMETVGQDPATGALGLGLTETVTAKLVEASDSDAIQVVSPRDLRDQGVKTAEDARRVFGTDLVLECSLQRSGQTIRINCYLVDSKTRRQLAAKSIEAEVTDSFGLQDRVVTAALDMLPTQIKPEDRRKLSVNQNTQPAAYEAYIRGRGYLQAYEKPENIANAIAEFKQALEIDSNYALAYAGLGDAYWTEFIRLDKGNEVVAAATRSCEKALSLNPDLVEGHVCLGNLLNGTGKYDKAVAEFKRAAESNGQNDEALRGLAESYTKLGNFAAAESTYKKAIELRPNYWGVYSSMGLFYYGQARYSDAAEMFLKATQLAPDNYQGYTTLGGVYIAEARYQDAIGAFQRSIDLRPSADAYSNLGYTYYLMHLFPEAISALEKAVQMDEGNWEMWGNLADALYWSRDRRADADVKYKRAIVIATSKVQVNPRDTRALAYLANYSAMIGDRRAAMDYIKRVLELAPADGEVLFRAAVVYNHFNQTEQTLNYLKKAADVGYSRVIIKDSPDFASLQQNPRFTALVTNGP